MSKPTRGQSYSDPLYDEIEAALERKYGLPSGGMRAIRTRGERSNSDQVSSAGAKTVYQIMPSTRRLFNTRYGVDAYASPEAAAEVAALHLRDSMRRNGGSWEAAVGEYHGGTDRSNWGRVNAAYRRRVLNSGSPAAGAKYSQEARGTTVTTTDLRDIPVDELLNSRPDDLFAGGRRGLDPVRKPKGPSASQRVTDILTGGDGIAVAPVDDSSGTANDRAQEKVWQGEAADRADDGFTDRFKAGFDETLAGRLIETVLAPEHEFDPEFMRFYKDNWQDIESFAKSDDEVERLREATSPENLQYIREQIEEEREKNKVLEASGHPTLWRIGTGVVDPVGWAAGLGVGKAFSLGGIGARALAISGRPVAAIGSASVEGAVGNLAVTAGLDANGDYVSGADYGISALTGLGIGALLGGATVWANQDNAVAREVQKAAMARQQQLDTIRADVVANLGPDASPEAVETAVKNRVAGDIQSTLEYALADIPAEDRIMVAEEILTSNEEFKRAITEASDLESVSDHVERAMVAETTARSSRIAERLPVDEKALDTFLAHNLIQQESTATRLLKSKSPVAKAVGLTLLENAQGAGGRRRTAAITMATRERVYNESFSGFDRLSATFRRQEGVSAAADFWDGRGRNAFNHRVFSELERRGADSYIPDSSPVVVQAADLFQQGMDLMRLEQQRVGTVGSARLGDSSVGYVPHRLDPRKILSLTSQQTKNVRDILAGQFRDIEGFDAEFADKLASKYLERAVDGAAGRYHVPFNLHSPEAGQIVRDALEGLNLPADELDKLMGKFSRGGAGHTKRRLRLDLEADLGDGMQLMDLFVTDIPTLFRSYARRVAGEVALAQYGVMGKKGLTILSKAMTATGATPQEVRAFDQIAAEFLNTPFGDGNHRWMDNARLATSAARLGGMGFTQFAEFGNAIPALGVTGMLKGIADVPRLIGEVRGLVKGTAEPSPLLQSVDQLNGTVGLDDYHLTRMFDVRDNDIELYNGESLGVVSRTLRGGAHANMVLSGHRMILAVQTRAMAEQIVRKAVKYAKTGEADTALDDMGIHQGLRAAIRKDLDRIATFDDKGELLTLDLFQGKALKPHMVAELSQAIERGSSQIIQRTYIGETGAWAHSGFLKLLFQFRTFSLTSVEKQWGRNVRNYGALKSMMYLAGAASFAIPIHLARVQAKASTMGGKEREKYLTDNTNPLALTRATMNYASASGLAGDIMDLGAGFASAYGGDFGERFGESYGVRGGGKQLVGGVAMPAAGYANDIWAGVMGDADKLVRSLPGSNLPYVSPFVTALLRSD